MTTQEIKLKIHVESDFFSALDPDQNMLSEEIISYFTRVFLNKHRQLREEYVIRIISDEPLNEEHVRSALLRECAQQKDDMRYALKRLMLKMICLAVLGVVFLAVWLYLAATTETVGVEILSIMGWVCVWEATSIIIMQRPELRRLWLNLDRLEKAKIVFQVTGDTEA